KKHSKKLSQIATYQFQKFIAGFNGFKLSAETRSRCYAILLLHSAHHHAHMRSFNNYGHSLWFQCIVYTFQNIVCQPFLHLQSSRKNINNTGNFAKPYNISIGNVGNMRLSEERQNMVFAK